MSYRVLELGDQLGLSILRSVGVRVQLKQQELEKTMADRQQKVSGMG
jgi:hypothetical protein